MLTIFSTIFGSFKKLIATSVYPAEGDWSSLKVAFAGAYLTWDQALFSFRSVNNIPARRENV